MPELPEVETVRRQLARALPFRICRADYSSVAASILKARNFRPEQHSILDVRRKGKWLHFHLDGNKSMLSHLGMSGAWIVAKGALREKHLHVRFADGERLLCFVDPRRFGKLYFLSRRDAEAKLSTLGTDIASEAFCEQYLSDVLKRFPKRRIKPFLLDQKYFAGSGNYIANEICARAGIRPTRRAGSLSAADQKRMVAAVREIISNGLRTNGLSFRGGYKDTRGEPGEALQNLMVFYQRTCQRCLTGEVRKIMLAQRGTYYCPRCQK